MEKEKFSLKDHLFNKEKVLFLSSLIKTSYLNFDKNGFDIFILSTIFTLWLKERVSLLTIWLKNFLPDDFKVSVDILIKSLPKKQNYDIEDEDFWDFIFATYSDFVAQYWCEDEYLDFSLESLWILTSSFSAEDSIRYFLNKFEEKTFKKMLEFSNSKDFHKRRLASEWSRPKLPWCQKINLDYKKTIKILDNLYFDSSRYVTRSVANHLNDISKIDSFLVVETLKKWRNSWLWSDLDYVISHSTRTLVKKWDKYVLKFLWFSENPNVFFKKFILEKNSLQIWNYLNFNFEISWVSEDIYIDYKIHFLLKNWKYWEKIFKLKKIKSWNIDKFSISKKHKIFQMSTRKIYQWKHYLEILINWKSFWKEEFYLL
jgi:3-methyladenine DNA glycosylase AlkC